MGTPQFEKTIQILSQKTRRMGSSWPRLAVEHRAVGRTAQPVGSSPGLYKLWLEAQWNGAS